MKNQLKQIIFSFLWLIILLPSSIFATSSANNEALEFRKIIGQKLKRKIDEVFANTPKLLRIYNSTQNTELSNISSLPEYQNLLSSKELKTLNNSPEMQEALKEIIKEVSHLIVSTNQQIDAINSNVDTLKKELQVQSQSGISVSEIKRKIYAQEAVVERLKTGISNVIQSLNQQKQLYFTDPKQAKNIGDFTPIQKPDTLTTDVILTDLINLDQVIDTRRTTANLEDYTIYAGDEITDNILWVKGLKSHTQQSEYRLVQGYKSDHQGVVIGLDLIDNTVGLAYAFIQDNVKSNTTKERINNHIATIYGFYELNNNLFINAQARYGRSYINKARQNKNLSSDISYAKTEGELYGGKLELCYDYIIADKTSIVPSIGITYDELKIKKYQEKGGGFNRGVAGRKVDKTTGLVGVKLSKAIEGDSYLVIPEIHVKYINTLNGNNGNTKITILDGVEPLITPSDKLQKEFYKVGGSLKIKKSLPINIEIGYDFGKSKKYQSHTGYISTAIVF